MPTPKQDPRSHAAVLKEQQGHPPIQAIREDTGESLWLVPSHSDARFYVLLLSKGETVECQCPQAQADGTCPHLAAVHLAMQPRQPEPVSPSLPQRSPSASRSLHPEPRNEQEQQQRERAEQRERALLWTDDRPFSIWKD
jgi:hypothetical protein